MNEYKYPWEEETKVTVEVTPDKGYVVDQIKADGVALTVSGTNSSDVVTATAGNIQADTHSCSHRLEDHIYIRAT